MPEMGALDNMEPNQRTPGRGGWGMINIHFKIKKHKKKQKTKHNGDY